MHSIRSFANAYMLRIKKGESDLYITRKGQYALFFMIELALHKGETITVKQVAGKYDLSEKYMEQVAVKLRRAGFINVIRGNHGGYYLDGNIDDYTARQIIDVIDGPKNAVDVDSYKISENNRMLNSIVIDMGNKVDNAIDDVLTNVTLGDLVHSYSEQLNCSYSI